MDASHDADDENAELRRRLTDLERALRQARGDLRRERAVSSQWRDAYHQARRRPPPPAAEGGGADPPASVAEAIERIEAEHPGAIAFRLIGSSNRRSPFRDPAALYLALRFLATTYREARRGHRACADLDKACREACGFTYSAHQSRVTMGRFARCYQVRWRGRRRLLREHLGRGTSKDPRDSIRVAFFYDERSQAVVVGFIGQHQRTAAT